MISLRTIKEIKQYLQYTHELLRQTSRNASPSETVLIQSILDNVEKNVSQIEALEELTKLQKSVKDKRSESLIEE